jgi:hypothetical protein
MARLRSSPYLSGTRSRLWRFVPAHPGALGRSTGQPPLDSPPDDGHPGAGPVLALISRLPLDLGD